MLFHLRIDTYDSDTTALGLSLPYDSRKTEGQPSQLTLCTYPAIPIQNHESMMPFSWFPQPRMPTQTWASTFPIPLGPLDNDVAYEGRQWGRFGVEVPFAGQSADDHHLRGPSFAPNATSDPDTRIVHGQLPMHGWPTSSYELAPFEYPTGSLPPTHGILENHFPGGVCVGASCPAQMALETDGTNLYRIAEVRDGERSRL